MKNLELFNTFEKQNSFFQSEIALTNALTTYLRKIGDGSKEDIYARLEDLIELDYDDFVQYFSEPRHLANHEVEETVYQVIADKRLLSIQEAQNEVHHYGYLLDILEKSSLPCKLPANYQTRSVIQRPLPSFWRNTWSIMALPKRISLKGSRLSILSSVK